MNHRIKVSVLTTIGASLVVGCAHLPQGYPSRTSQGQAAVDKPASDALFVTTDTALPGKNTALDALESAPAKGLRVRQSKRGNMDSYVVRGQRYFTKDSSDGYSARGLASWYGPNFHGRVASNGEIYDMYQMTAAHKTLPLPTFARVTHLDNGKSIIVKINDRGPFSGDRLIDLSFAAALELGMVNDGTAMVEIKALSPQELLVLSGPKNKLGVEFYYDHHGEPASDDMLAAESLFVNDKVPLFVNDREAPQAEQQLAQLPAVSDVPVDFNSLPAISDHPTVADTSVSVPVMNNGAVNGTVVEVAAVEAEYLEVVVPGRKPPGTEELQQPSTTKEIAFAGLDVPLAEFRDEAKAANTQVVNVPLGDAVAAIPAPSIDGLTALKTADKPVNAAAAIVDTGLRYYLQAGVFANVNDAEQLATNIVLEVPREEVHVKPLKGSEMFRVTIGPIVNKDHASQVAEKLSVAGIENYTVKVKES